LGWAEITHPFHPRKGQRFPVLKTRRVAGRDTLILGDAAAGSFGIVREWTDWGAPSDRDATATCRFDLGMLLDLIDLIDLLPTPSPKKSSKKGLDK
jgi:hypothetical protein